MSEGFSRKPRVGGKGGLSPSRLTPGSWGPCLQAGSHREVGVSVSKPAHPRLASSPSALWGGGWTVQAARTRTVLSSGNLISIRCCPLAVWHGTGALEGLLSPLEQKKRKESCS